MKTVKRTAAAAAILALMGLIALQLDAAQNQTSPNVNTADTTSSKSQNTTSTASASRTSAGDQTTPSRAKTSGKPGNNTRSIDAAPVYEFPSDRLDEMRQKYLEQHGLVVGENRDGSWIGYASATVNRTPGKGWATAYVNSFIQAQQEVQGKFVRREGVQVVTKTLSNIFKDDAFVNQPDQSGEPNQTKRIQEKLKTLTEAKLDDVLKKLGVSKEKIASMSGPRKRDTFRRKLTSKVITSAAGSVDGLRTLQTFEGRVGNTYAVGVLMRWSPHYEEEAALLRQGGGKMIGSRSGHPISYYLPDKDQKLIKAYGVRVLPGPDGNPLYVAFSPVGVNFPPGASRRSKQRRLNGAYVTAENLAAGMITDFATASTNSKQSAKVGGKVLEQVSTDATGFQQFIENPGSVAQQMMSRLETRGRLKIQGGSVVRRWRARHSETKSLFAGVVYVWNPAAARSVARERAGKSTVRQQKERNPASSGSMGPDFPIDINRKETY